MDLRVWLTTAFPGKKNKKKKDKEEQDNNERVSLRVAFPFLLLYALLLFYAASMPKGAQMIRLDALIIQ